MRDGGMGSLRTVGATQDKRHYGKVLCEARLTDQDGVPVVASIIVDSVGELYELDMWKVDFSPLKHFPASTS